MRNNQGAGAGRNSRFDKVRIDIVGADLRINQNGDKSVLNDGSHGAREGHSRGNHLVTFFEVTVQVMGHQGPNRN